MQKILVGLYRITIGLTLMFITGSIALLLKWVTFGRSTNFGRKYLVAPTSKFILRLIGVRFQLPDTKEYSTRQVMYTFNHNSYLDILIVTALAVPNSRFFLSEKTWKYLPLTISAMAIGVCYIPIKSDAKRRLRFFKRIEKELHKGKHSIFVSSEGVHLFQHGIAPFNNGVYHLATNCHLPIQPVYLHIPKETNSLEGFDFKSGKIEVYLLEEVSTLSWKLEDLEVNKNAVREIFLKEYEKRNEVIK